MSARTCLAIVLAAGEGTRMRATLPKVLHQIGNRTLLEHALRTAMQAGGSRLSVVIGPSQTAVADEVRRIASEAQIFEQRERLGTAHAVLAAREALVPASDDILVMFADTPLVRAETLGRLRQALADGAAVVVLGFTPADPTGYGRLITRDDELIAIREEKDASAEEKKISLCNGGLMALSGKH